MKAEKLQSRSAKSKFVKDTSKVSSHHYHKESMMKAEKLQSSETRAEKDGGHNHVLYADTKPKPTDHRKTRGQYSEPVWQPIAPPMREESLNL